VAALFFDSSSLVKRYAVEIGTNWVFNLVRPSAKNRLYLARITGVEVIAALIKRIRVGSLTSSANTKAVKRFEREFSNRYVLIEVSPKVIQTAMTLAKNYTLRGYDAVQLGVLGTKAHFLTLRTRFFVQFPSFSTKTSKFP